MIFLYANKSSSLVRDEGELRSLELALQAIGHKIGYGAQGNSLRFKNRI